MSLWNCIECGCKAIAHGLGFCPQCFKPREAEDVPKVTSGGATNAADPDRPVVPAEQPQDAADEPQEGQEEPQQDQDGQEETPAAQEADEGAKDALSELEAAAASLKRQPKTAAKQDG